MTSSRRRKVAIRNVEFVVTWLVGGRAVTLFDYVAIAALAVLIVWAAVGFFPRGKL